MPEATVKMYVHPSITQIILGDKPDEVTYAAGPDGVIEVPESEVPDFLVMGCTTKPYVPVMVSNVAPAN